MCIPASINRLYTTCYYLITPIATSFSSFSYTEFEFQLLKNPLYHNLRTEKVDHDNNLRSLPDTHPKPRAKAHHG